MCVQTKEFRFRLKHKSSKKIDDFVGGEYKDIAVKMVTKLNKQS